MPVPRSANSTLTASPSRTALYVDRRVRGGVLDCVLEEVDDDLFDEHGIHRNQRCFDRNVRLYQPSAQTFGEAAQRRSDHLVDGLVPLLDLDRSRFEPRHGEHVGDEPFEALGLLDDGIDEAARAGAVAVLR